MIPACVFIAENTVLEREVTVMLFSVTDQTNIQGAYLYYIASKDSRTCDHFLVADLLPFFEILIFGPSTTTTQCRNITVVNDNALESDQLIQLSLESSDSAVLIPNPIVNILIIDLDSK